MTTDLLGLDLDGLKTLMSSLGQPTFRAKQVHHWLYEQRVKAALKKRKLDDAAARAAAIEKTAEKERAKLSKQLDKKLEAAGLDPDKLAELDEDEVAFLKALTDEQYVSLLD